MDVDERHLGVAASLAGERGLRNTRFENANVYRLAYPDGSFDAAFSHALLEHLRDQPAALRELRRVLKPGGVIGVREGDARGGFVHPPHPDLDPQMPAYQRMLRHNGGDGNIGGHLKGLLREAGFARVEVKAVYDTYATPEAVRRWAGMIAGNVREINAGDSQPWLATTDELERTARACLQWAEKPDAFFARGWVEALAWAD